MYDNNNELLYEGEFLNSLPHGFGMSYNNGKLLYIGKWNNNFYHGYGLLINDDNNKYGLFQEGKLIEEKIHIPLNFQKYINKSKSKNPIKTNIKPVNNIIVSNPFNSIIPNPIIKKSSPKKHLYTPINVFLHK